MSDYPAVAVERRRELTAPADVVWARAASEAGIRHEMAPVLRMTMPPGLRGRSIDDAADLVGRPLGRAWLFLFGVLPVDVDDMALEAVGERWFQERSRMLTLGAWGHRREIRPLGDGRCEVHDRLEFTPPLDVALVRGISRRLVELFFAHRQRRLAAWARAQG